MPSPFPGMDPYLETNPIFHELHTQMLSEAQAQLQPQLRPKYVARLERPLSKGSVWEANSEQRRIVIYVRTQPRMAVASIELLSPSNKATGSVGQSRYLEKRASALHGGLHWIEIDLLRGGQRPPLGVTLSQPTEYMAYVAQATLTGWHHLVYGWSLREPLPIVPIPLLGSDRALLDLGACFRSAYDRIAADDEADYTDLPPPPEMRTEDTVWAAELLHQHGMRPS